MLEPNENNEFYGKYPINTEMTIIKRDPNLPEMEFYEYRHAPCPKAGKGWLAGLLPSEQPCGNTIWLERKPLPKDAVRCPACDQLVPEVS